MKKLTVQILALITVVLSLSSCGKDENPLLDELQGNEYLIKIDGKVYEESKSLFAGIAKDLSDDDAMQAGINTTLTIAFESSHYNTGEVLVVGNEGDPGVTAIAVGILVLNPDTENEDIIAYVATSGTATIVSKKRIEFNLTCYRFSDLDIDGGLMQGATPFVLSGYVTESSPV